MLVKTILLSAAASLLMAGASPSSARASSGPQPARTWDRTLSFTVAPNEGSERDRVQLSLRYQTRNSNSHYGRTFDRADLQGLGSADGPVRFRIAREAGSIDCTGMMRDQRGSGECRFTPDEGFAAELANRGIGRAEADELFHLAMAGVGRPLLAELEQQSYPRPTVGQLVALGIHGADLDYLRGLDSAGYRVGNLEQLVAFRIHGVTPAYIAELRSLGGAWANLPAERLVEMRIHGVTPAFAGEMNGLGLRDLGPSQLVALRIHGVTPAYVREMAAAGYRDLTFEQLLALRIHGVRAADAAAINAALAGRTD